MLQIGDRPELVAHTDSEGPAVTGHLTSRRSEIVARQYLLQGCQAHTVCLHFRWVEGNQDDWIGYTSNTHPGYTVDTVENRYNLCLQISAQSCLVLIGGDGELHNLLTGLIEVGTKVIRDNDHRGARIRVRGHRLDIWRTLDALLQWIGHRLLNDRWRSSRIGCDYRHGRVFQRRKEILLERWNNNRSKDQDSDGRKRNEAAVRQAHFRKKGHNKLPTQPAKRDIIFRTKPKKLIS